MKRILRTLSLGSTIFLSACTLNKPPVLLQSVGPAPLQEHVSGNRGSLVVYSAWAIDANSNRHSSYELITDDGQPARHIPNRIDMYDSGPTPVALTPGWYKVSAPAWHSGRVIAPVEIKAGRTTFLYLDGSTQPPKPLLTGSNLVTLPNGQMAGWATEDAKR